MVQFSHCGLLYLLCMGSFTIIQRHRTLQASDLLSRLVAVRHCGALVPIDLQFIESFALSDPVVEEDKLCVLACVTTSAVPPPTL